jgi:hypothetical protein
MNDNTIDASEPNSVPPTAEAKSAESTPKLETRDGKVFLDGHRIYTRDETNKIAANAKQEALRQVLNDLEVDDLDQVKSVVKSLRTAGPEGNNTLNVDQMRDTLKRKEATVEELQTKIKGLQEQMILNQHMSELYSNMPSNLNKEQRQAVVDLMKARSMIQIDGEQFILRNGESFYTQDGEKPDYKGAVNDVVKILGLPTSKQGVEIPNMDKSPRDTSVKSVDRDRMKTDRAYNSAYVAFRSQNPLRPIDSITDADIKSMMTKKSEFNMGIALRGAEALRNNTARK